MTKAVKKKNQTSTLLNDDDFGLVAFLLCRAGYFSLELVYDPKAPPGYTSGGPFQYLGLSLDSTLATIAYKVDAAVRKEHQNRKEAFFCFVKSGPLAPL